MGGYLCPQHQIRMGPNRVRFEDQAVALGDAMEVEGGQ
jgi:hypothetical protein